MFVFWWGDSNSNWTRKKKLRLLYIRICTVYIPRLVSLSPITVVAKNLADLVNLDYFSLDVNYPTAKDSLAALKT